MAMRMSGLMSGMDTESIIKELVSVKQTKVDDAKKAQTKLQWKQDAWKELNTKLKTCRQNMSLICALCLLTARGPQKYPTVMQSA